MNERIKLLAEQAGFSFKYKTAPDEMNPGHKLKDLKKFAELIVKECMEWCDAHATIDGSAQQIRNSIKNYFGVDE